MTDRPASPRHSDAPAGVYDRITDPTFALDESWRVTYRDERAAEVLGEEESVLGRDFWTVAPDDIGSAARDEYERAVATQDPVTFEALHGPLESCFEVRAYPSETGLTVTLRDVTERVDRKQRLEKRERALRDAYEVIAAPDRSFSGQIDDLLGVVRETIGTDYATLSRVDESTDEYVFEAVSAPEGADLSAGDTTSLQATNCERVVGTERTLVLDDVDADAPDLAGRSGNAEWGISCYLGAPVMVDGEVYGTFCFYDMEARSDAFTDWEVAFVDLLSRWVSSELERERRERELEVSNERLEQFASVASHDLQEPLRMVSSHLSLVEQRYGDDLDEAGQESLEYAVDGAERMYDLIEGLLEYSRVDTQGDPFGPVDLNAVLEDVLADLQLRIEGTDAEITSDDDLPTVEGDASQLRQVFQNLLENATQYSDEPPRIEVSADRRGDEWVVSVADEGIGIDTDDVDRVFEVFRRLHTREEYEGTGIGLALCKRVVERHGGDIWVDSVPGEGATFSFTLPATGE